MKSWVLAILALMTACTPLPPQPARLKAYAGLTPGNAQPAQSSVQPPIQGAGESVALVVSSSSEKQFEYVEAVIAALKGGGCIYSADVEQRGRPAIVRRRG